MRRRLIAFISMAATALSGIVAGFVVSSRKVNPGLELTGGKTFVYEISNEDNGNSFNLDDAAKEMQRRLDMAEVTYYEIEKEGTDQIRVSVAGDSQTLTHVRNLMSYNADFTISTTDDEVTYTYDEFFNTEEKAKIEYVNQYPVVIFPIADETKVNLLCEHAQTLLSSEEQDGGNEEGNSSNETLSYLILWADKEEGDDYANAMNEEYEGYEKIRDKVFLTFASKVEDLWYDEKHEAIAKTVNYADSEGKENENPSAAEIKNACRQAMQVVDYFNAGKLDYDVEFLYDLSIEGSMGNIIILGDRAVQLNWGSGIVVATLVSVVMVGLYLAIVYKLGALITGLSTAGTVVTTLALYNGLGIEFGIGAIFGLIGVAALTLFTNIFILSRIKNEAYKGRSFKKAQSEGQKQSIFVIVDASVVVLCAAFIAFFVGGRIVQEVAAMVSIGAVANLVVGWLSNRLLTWSLCNESSLQDKKFLLGINDKLVPNTLNDEKQTYFGRYADKDTTKAKTPVGIAGGIIAVASTVFGILFGTVFNCGSFNYGHEYDSHYRVQMIVTKTSKLADSSKLVSGLKEAGFNVKLGDIKYDEEYNKDDKEALDCFYSVDVELPSESARADMYTDNIGTVYTISDDECLDVLGINVYNQFKAEDSNIKVKVMLVTPYQHNVKVWLAGIAIGAGIVLASIYIFVRYGLGKAVAGLVTSLMSTMITMGIFMLARVPFTDSTVIALFAVASVALLLCMFIFARDKELFLDDKNINKVEAMKKATSQSLTAMIALTSSIALVSIFFYVFAWAFSLEALKAPFACLLFGVLIDFGLVISICGPIYSAIRRSSTGVSIKRKRSKKHEEKQEKSAEPEEAIFIGIND